MTEILIICVIILLVLVVVLLGFLFRLSGLISQEEYKKELTQQSVDEWIRENERKKNSSTSTSC